MSPAAGVPELFAKHGDVILLVDDRRFLVWSGALRLASPVFAVMFDGRFSEGQALSAASPPELPLPDDDPTSMSLLCKITHMRTAEISTTLSATDLIKLALLADKYDCVHVLLPWAKLWVPALMPVGQFDNLEKPLVAAYMLDLPDEFFKISQSMIRDSPEPLDVVAALAHVDALPICVVDQILKKQHDAQKRALAAFDQVVSGNELWCRTAFEDVGKCFKKFREDELWPLGIPSVLHLKTKAVGCGVSTSQGNCSTSCVCRSVFVSKSDIVKTINDVYDGVNGLCLGCIKPRYTAHIQTCQSRSP